MRAVTDVTSQRLRRLRESRAGTCPDGPRAPQGRQGHRRGRGRPPRRGEDDPAVGASRRRPRERSRLLSPKIFQALAGGLSPGMAFGTEFALRLGEVRFRAASLPGPDEIGAPEAAAV